MVVSSSGGHFSQISMLLKVIEHDSVLILNERVHKNFNCPTHKIIHTNSYFIMLIHIFEAIFYNIKYHPEVIITSGAAPGAIFGIVAKYIFRKKFVFIESFSRVLTPSLSGKIASRYATEYICQHEELASSIQSAKYIKTIC